MYVYTDSSGARSGKVLVVFGMAPRSDSQWSDSTLQCQWTQILLTLALSLSASRPSWRLGLYNTPNTPAGALERCDDPGRVFVRRQNVRALLCAAGLLGCEDAVPSSSWATFHFTLLLGLVMMLPLAISLRSRRAANLDDAPTQSEQDAPEPLPEPFAMDEAVDAMPLSLLLSPGVTTSSMDPLSSNLPVSTTPIGGRSMRGFDTEDQIPNQVFLPEAMLTWMYTRCLRRQSALEEGAPCVGPYMLRGSM